MKRLKRLFELELLTSLEALASLSRTPYQDGPAKFGPIRLKLQGDENAFTLTWTNRMNMQTSRLVALSTREYELQMTSSAMKNVVVTRKYDTLSEAFTSFLLNTNTVRVPQRHYFEARRTAYDWLIELGHKVELHLARAAQRRSKFLNREVLIKKPAANQERGVLAFISPGGRVGDVVINGKLRTVPLDQVWYD